MSDDIRQIEIMQDNAEHKGELYAETQMGLLGLKPGDPLYMRARKAALEGWPAFRIAQAYNLPIDD